jgi:hypothetical protein
MAEPAVPATPRPVPEAGDARTGGGGRVSLLASLVGSVGWLAGSLGAIGGILYASGYLISVAQLHLLGLGRLVTYSHDHYVQQGGSFFVSVGTLIMIAAVWFSLVAVPVLGIHAAVRWTGLAHGIWRNRVETVVRWRRWPWRGLAYVLLIGLLAFRGGDPQSFGQPLTISNLLFPDPPVVAANPVRDLLVAGDSNGLAGQFEERLFTYLFVLLLFIASAFVTQRWPLRRLAVAPFALLLLIYTILLPMLFGVLKLPVEFPVVTVRLSGDAPLTAGGQTFLLTKGDQDFILFEAGDRKVVWLRQERVERIDVDRIAPILRRTAPEARNSR